MKKLILILIGLCLFINGYSQSTCCPYINNISVFPTFPNSNDDIQIITTTNCPALGNQISYQHTISNDTIYLNACFYSGLALAIQTYVDTTNIGKLLGGNYTIYYTAYMSDNPNNCNNKIDTNELSKPLIVSNATNINNINDKYIFQFYPNPSNFELNIKTERDECVFSICDLYGNVIRNGKFNKKTSINLQEFTKGTYIIKISNRDNIMTSKLLIQ